MNAIYASSSEKTLKLFCCAAALCEMVELCILLLIRLQQPVLAAGLYLSVLLWQITWLHYTQSRHRPLAALLVVMTAVTGPFGCGICLLAAIVYGSRAAAAVPPEEWIKRYFLYEDKEESEKVRERIAFGLDNLKPEHGIEPLQDILETGTVLQKQTVVVKIMRYFCPQFTPFLLKALQDGNPAVRVQAATAVAKIERDFMTQYIALENALQNTAAPYDIRLRLARLYDGYAHAGLTDEGSKKLFREKAIAAYEQCCAERATAELRHAIARIYVRHGQYKKAEILLQPEVAAKTVSTASLLWYMEALFHLKKFQQLRETAGSYRTALGDSRDSMLSKEIKNVLCAWSA